MNQEQAQRRIIAAALFCVGSTALMPSPYEELLAEQYITGSLNLRYAIKLLEDYKHRQTATCPVAPGNC